MTSPKATATSTASNRINASGNNNGNGNSRRSRVGEATGGCAAVWCCCCLCAMMHLMILAVYRLPAGLWRKKKKRSRPLNKGRKSWSEKEENVLKKKSETAEEGEDCGRGGKIETLDWNWDKEMWCRFVDGAGFWRSTSPQDDD